ncbi:HAD family hydrolase [Myxococcus xanthus]|uniref:HAD family hydrolase n=1 Tax=Myxococcus xanthus TaxID=34 RepID=UPI001F51AA2B|nr:HAD family hydrolase [Myxococcus xanthus]
MPAGAFNAGREAVRIQAKQAFTDSPLVALLRRAPTAAGGPALHTRFWDRVSRRWVVTVLFVSALGLALWWPAGPDKALEVAVALLVVTCPCAIGIATPLAYELVQARLRRGGFFIRSTDLLDRLPRVRKVLFDKTGTLTLGRLELVDRAAVAGLTAASRDIAFDLVSRSNHPASRCLAAALAREGARFNSEARVSELAGQGLELNREGVRWRLGRADWATEAVDTGHPEREPTDGASCAGGSPASRHSRPSGRVEVLLSGSGLAAGPVLTRDGVPVAFFQLRESVRPDARREVQALQGEGREVWLISGDSHGRVSDMAAALGIPTQHTLSGQRPEDKAEAVAKLDAADTLYLGDGVNDSLAFERALCAGTPAIDRPVMPGKSDFFLLGEGLGAIREALRLSARLRQVVRRLLLLAVSYNVVAVAVCLAGWMTPLRAAVAMPATSLATVLFTVWWLSASRERAAASPTPPLREVPA